MIVFSGAAQILAGLQTGRPSRGETNTESSAYRTAATSAASKAAPSCSTAHTTAAVYLSATRQPRQGHQHSEEVYVESEREGICAQSSCETVHATVSEVFIYLVIKYS